MICTKRPVFLFALTAILVSHSAQSRPGNQYSRIIVKRQSEPDNPGDLSKNRDQPSSQAPPQEAPSKSQTNNGPIPFGHHPALYPQFPPPGAFAPPFSPPLSSVGVHYGPPPLYPGYPGSAGANGPQDPPHFAGQDGLSPPARSAKFINDLGRRLMSMIGIGGGKNGTQDGQEKTENFREQESGASNASNQEQLQALRNATVLQQLNRGMHSVFSNLSKMWNSTVQQQLDILQDRIGQETSNSSNPVQQRIAQQVPLFFKAMVARVSDAQENLNKFWKQVSNQNGTVANITQLESRLGSTRERQRAPPQIGDGGFFPPVIDAYTEKHEPQQFNFFNQIQRTFGFGGGPPPGGPGGDESGNGGKHSWGDQGQGLKTSVMEFWHDTVQPHMARLQGKISRVWQDLTNNGVVQAPLQQEPSFGGFIPDASFGANPGRQDTGSASPASIENLLKSIDLNSPEYTLIEPEEKTKERDGHQVDQSNNVGTKIQSTVINMQRELNQMWHGLTNSLQSALTNVRRLANPPPPPPRGPVPFVPLAPASSQNDERFVSRRLVQQNESTPPDSSANEIDGKIKELARLQRDAENVYNVIEDQQRQQQQQKERASLADRFKTFVHNTINMGDHVPQGLQETFNNWGHSVNDFWHQIPNRWDRFVNHDRTTDYPRANVNTGGNTASRNGDVLSPSSSSSSSSTTSSSSSGTTTETTASDTPAPGAPSTTTPAASNQDDKMEGASSSPSE